MKKRRLAGCGLGFLFLILLGLWGLKRWMEAPMYEPGSVRLGRDLCAPVTPGRDALEEPGFTKRGDGVRLHVEEHGSGPLALVMHGGPGFPQAGPWAGLRPLEDRFRFLYYHQRGAGRSTRPFERLPAGNPGERMQTLHRTLGIPAHLGDAELLRRAHGTGPMILIGHSFGAFLAALYATEFPEEVRALVLVSPAPLFEMPPADGGLLEVIRRALPAEDQDAYGDFLDRYLDFMAAIESDEQSLAALNRELVPFYRKAAQALGASDPGPAPADNGGFVVQALYLSLGARHSWGHLTEGLKMPVLVLHGARDLQSEASSRSYLELFPQATFHRFDGAGHAAHDEDPEAFARVVGAFLDGLDRP